MQKKNKMPAILFYTGDWLKDPAVRCCSLAARGLWMDMLCLMYESPTRGYLSLANGDAVTTAQLARMVGDSPKCVGVLLDELLQCGVYSVSAGGVIFSRRMISDELEREAKSRAGKEGMRRRYGKNEGDITEPQQNGNTDDNKDVTPVEYEYENETNTTNTQPDFFSARESRTKCEELWHTIPENRQRGKGRFADVFARIVCDNSLLEKMKDAIAAYYSSDEGKGRFWRTPPVLLEDEIWEENRGLWGKNRGEITFPQCTFEHSKIITRYKKVSNANKDKIEKMLKAGQEEGSVAYQIWKKYPELR